MNRLLTLKRILTACLLGITISVTAEADQGLNHATLAKEILADQNLRAVHQMA